MSDPSEERCVVALVDGGGDGSGAVSIGFCGGGKGFIFRLWVNAFEKPLIRNAQRYTMAW